MVRTISVLNPLGNRSEAHPNLAAAARGLTLLDEDGERDPVAEIDNLLHVEPPILVKTSPLFEEPPDSCNSVEVGAGQSQRVRLPDGVGRNEAEYGVPVRAIRRLEHEAHTCDQIGGRDSSAITRAVSPSSHAAGRRGSDVGAIRGGAASPLE